MLADRAPAPLPRADRAAGARDGRVAENSMEQNLTWGDCGVQTLLTLRPENGPVPALPEAPILNSSVHFRRDTNTLLSPECLSWLSLSEVGLFLAAQRALSGAFTYGISRCLISPQGSTAPRLTDEGTEFRQHAEASTRSRGGGTRICTHALPLGPDCL